jgi:predicted nucleic acid-binding protein
MAYLLALDSCVAWLRGQRHLRARVAQNPGLVYVSALTMLPLGEFLVRASTPAQFRTGYFLLAQLIAFEDVTEPIAYRASRLVTHLRLQGRRLKVVSSIVAATALERGWAVVTRDPAYQVVPGLTLHDWTVP